MKKYIVLILTVLLIIVGGIFLYFKNNKSKVENVSNAEITKEMTAEDIINAMKEQNSNIGKVVIYNEETDLNKLLGRPNQYTSKITFEDKRIEQKNTDNEFLSPEEQNEPTGGTIEVFNNSEDMMKRKEYINQISSSASIFNQYIYSKNKVLLRLENELAPTQAKEYEDLFNTIVK